MSTIKINELAEGTMLLSDYLVKAGASGIATKITLNQLQTFLNTIGVSGYKGIVTSNVGGIPQLNGANITEDGSYIVGENGDFGTFIGLDISDNVIFLDVKNLDTTPIYSKVEIPISLVLDTTPTEGSTNAVESGGVKNYVDSKVKNTFDDTDEVNTSTMKATADYVLNNKGIDFDELTTKPSLNLTDNLVLADNSNSTFKGSLQEFSNFFSTASGLDFKGDLLIADTPTEDGWYFAGESGTYTNAGNLIIDLTNTLAVIIVSATQTVFKRLEIPIVANTDTTPLVVVASGQSNMDGAGSGGYMFPENNDVQMLDLTTRTFRNVSYTNRLTRTNINSGTAMTIPSAAGNNNLAFSFCHNLHLKTGRKVYLIIVSNGGTHIGRWMGTEADDISAYSGGWGGIGVEKPLYVELKSAVEDALVLIGVNKIDAFLWHQGETKRPNHTTVADYERDFNIFYNQLKAETWWSDDVKFVSGELVVGSRYDENQEFIRSLSYNDEPNIRTTSTIGLGIQPESNITLKIHYDGAGLNELGRRYLNAFYGDRAFFANRYDKETTLYGATDVEYLIEGVYTDVITIDPLKGRILEKKGESLPRDGGGWLAGQIATNPISCTVEYNDDGTFTVSPVSIVYTDWSFDILDTWIEGPATTRTATIKGVVSDETETKVKLWIEAPSSETATINVNFTPYLNKVGNANNLLTIDWGDGTIDTGLSSGTNSHVYNSAYTGYVELIMPKNSDITFLQLSSGTWAFSMSDLSHLIALSYLSITAGTNKVFGDLKSLPNAMATINIQGNNTVTWDLTGLPNLASLEARGNNTIRRYNNSVWEGSVSVSKIQVGGVNLTSSELDDFLNALTPIKGSISTSLIYLAYGSNARTSASDAAVTYLQGIGFTVSTP